MWQSVIVGVDYTISYQWRKFWYKNLQAGYLWWRINDWCNNWVIRFIIRPSECGDETKYRIAKRLITALELQSTHSTSDAVVANTKSLSECVYGGRHERYNSYSGFSFLCTGYEARVYMGAFPSK